MTITMNLEAEVGLSFSEIESVLSSMSSEYLMGDGDLTGNFELSKCYFVFRYIKNAEDVVAEGSGVAWKVGVRGAFHCSISALEECSKDIKEFLRSLSLLTSFRFLLSFQFESIYAIYDGVEVKFIKDMVE